MRPFRSFLLLLIVLICFAGLSYILPWDLNLPTAESLIPEKLIRNLIAHDSTISPTEELNAADTSLVFVRTTPAVITDTTSVAINSSPPDPMRIFLDSLQFSQGQVRILYYGDSQIEYDRVTSYLRRSLRKDHGGTGPGLFLPVMPVTYTKSFYVRASSNWRRFNYLSFKNGEIKHNDLGPFMAFCRYLPDGQVSSDNVKSWIRITPSTFSDTSESKYENLRILYRNTLDKVKIDVRSGSNAVISDTLKISSKITEFSCPLSGSKNILIDFSGKTSPDIYAISIESKNGVVVDNIPQRGSAGLEFTMVDKENLRDSYALLKPDLIVLQYGLNLATNIRNDYSYYEKGLSRQLKLLKEISPGTGLMVIGLTDMAHQDGDVIKSYPNIPKIINAQRNAALNSETVFWDAYTAMGGRSTIIKWFGMNPPLAKKDYVHLTDQGADTLARMMISDLFTIKDPEPYIKTPPDVLIDTIELAKAKNISVPMEFQEKPGYLRTLVSAIFSYDPDKPFIFSAAVFWIFLLFVLAGYSLFYKRMVLRNLYLFLVSLFFYYKTGGLFLFILIFVTVTDYICGLLIHRAKRKGTRKLFVLLSIISNLGLLGYFKYTGFVISLINNVLGTHLKVIDLLSSLSNSVLGTSFDISYIILPVGISFFTFQSLSYTIDVYRRKMDPVRNIIDFGFYVSFFPHLVAGPIVRASVFIPQLYQEFRLAQREFSHALFMISKGLIKKIVISNFIAINLVDRVFDAPSVYSGLENLMAVYGYGLQIYCDFSGYTDIAIGVALILGFRLPVNFNSPYKAQNIADFWKRWHISLSQWLRDYLYISLGGNRKGKFRMIINLMITMLLGGLWHGADLRFVIWGALHGIGLAVNKLRISIFGEKTQKVWIVRAISIFFTFQFVSFCWIFFRAPDMHSVGLILRQIFQSFLPLSFSNLFPAYAGVLAMMSAGYIFHFLPEKFKESYRGLFIKIPLALQIVIVILTGFLLYQMRTTEIMPFIYFRF
jgi:D-alanyl-lipoteichoic acid acyltransferase DltB (MBOAT superfamily)/lysophospholipase L1-like esterase